MREKGEGMECPFCNINFHKTKEKELNFEFDLNNREYNGVIEKFEKEYKNNGGKFSLNYCPKCLKGVISYSEGIFKNSYDSEHQYFYNELIDEDKEKIVFPFEGSSIFLSNSIPQIYINEFKEAYLIKNLSPKASAAISRRCLQLLIRNEFNIKRNNLFSEIEAFLEISDLPTNLIKVVDAIRQIGNIAAHPTKYKFTERIVEIEVEEADWLLEILHEIFDFKFIKPELEKKRTKELEIKLKKIKKG